MARLASTLLLQAAAEQRPLGIAVSGGGYTSMTAGMALSRALRNLPGDALAKVTHLGGNSGGSFFTNQLLYSEEFFQNVTDPTLPLDQVVDDWLDTHLAAMRDLMDKKGSLQQEF